MKKVPGTDREFVERWKRVGPLLERIRRRELRSLNYAENFAIYDSLLQLGFDHSPARTSSGLMDLQRLFAKARP